ncbi:hypothetical protein MMC29_001814 [Sticta canariensis]|nr:hypothetical protein [Sticta canariensis]
MDTVAYLTRQGWLGSGHSLDPSGHGIAKPLLISKKSDLLGLGKPKIDVHADQWWARDFDTTLKRLNVSTDGAPETPENVALERESQPVERSVLGSSKRRFDLYGHFVQGEGLSGTHTPEAKEQAKTESCQDLHAMENEDEPSGHPKRQKHVKKKRESPTQEITFSSHPNNLTPKVDVCGSETPEDNPRTIKRGFEMGRGEENQSSSKLAFINTKKGSRGPETARKKASKEIFPRKQQHRRRGKGV